MPQEPVITDFLELGWALMQSYAVLAGIVAGIIAFFVATFTADHWIAGIISGLIFGYATFMVVSLIEGTIFVGAAIKHRLSMTDEEKKQLEMVSVITLFHATVEKEDVVSHFCNIYPSERKGALGWICKRVTDEAGDDLCFAIGVSSFEDVREYSPIPMTLANINFYDAPQGMTLAAFSFSVHASTETVGSLLGKGFVHGKEMTELVESVRNSFIKLDPGCRVIIKEKEAY